MRDSFGSSSPLPAWLRGLRLYLHSFYLENLLKPQTTILQNPCLAIPMTITHKTVITDDDVTPEDAETMQETENEDETAALRTPACRSTDLQSVSVDRNGIPTMLVANGLEIRPTLLACLPLSPMRYYRDLLRIISP